MSATPVDGDQLPCGTLVDDLLEQVADRRPAADPAHQAGCVHCRAALAELAAIWAPVHQAATEGVTVPAGLLDRVMSAVRDLVANSWYAVIDSGQGLTRIAAWVIATMARSAAGRVAGVSYATSRTGGQPGGQTTSGSRLPAGRPSAPDGGVGVAGRRVVINLELVAELGSELPTLADRVRAQVHRDVAAMTGLNVVEINITVADLDDSGPVGRFGTRSRDGS